MPLHETGISVVSGSRLADVGTLEFTGSFVSVSKSNDKMVINVGPNFGGNQPFPTFDLDSWQNARVLLTHIGYPLASGSSSSSLEPLTLTKLGSLPFYSGLQWDCSGALVRDDTYPVVNAVGLPSVEQFRYFVSQSASGTFLPDIFTTSSAWNTIGTANGHSRYWPPQPLGVFVDPFTDGCGISGQDLIVRSSYGSSVAVDVGYIGTTLAGITASNFIRFELHVRPTASINTTWVYHDLPSGTYFGTPYYSRYNIGFAAGASGTPILSGFAGAYFNSTISCSGTGIKDPELVTMTLSSSVVSQSFQYSTSAPDFSILIESGTITMNGNGHVLSASVSSFIAEGNTLFSHLSYWADYGQTPIGNSYLNLHPGFVSVSGNAIDSIIYQTQYAHTSQTFSASLNYAFWDQVTYTNNVFENNRVRNPGVYPSTTFP